MRLSIARLAAVRLRNQWPMALAQVLGLAAAVALALTVPLVESAAAEAGLHQVLSGLGSAAYIQLEQFGKADPQSWDSFETSASARFHSTLSAYAVPGARYAAAGQALPVTLNGVTVLGSGNEPIGDTGYYEQLAPHVRVVEGAAPVETSAGTDPYPSTMSAEGARQYGYHVGDVICLVSGVTTTRFRVTPNTWCTRLAGTWAPNDPTEAYWGGSVPYRTLLLDRSSYFGLMQRVASLVNSRAGQFYGPNLPAINSSNVASVVDRVNQLRGYFGVQREGLFSTGLDTGIKAYLVRVGVASFTIQLVAAALLVVAGYSIAFLAGHFLDAQAALLAVLRARGWSHSRVLRLILAQYLLLGLAAVPAGVAGAAALTVLLARGYLASTAFPLQPADIPGLLPFALATLAGLAALVIAISAAAARRDVLEVRRASSRPASRPWYQWRNLDLGLALLAIPLLLEVRFQGSGDVRAAAGSNDPTALALPAIALALLALASLRLMPVAAAVARAAARGVAGNLAAWQISRRPGQHARLAMLVSFTVAVGLFSTVYSATEHRNTIDRADYQSGADVRALFQGFNQSPPNVDGALARIGTTAAASKAFRGTGSPGRSNLDATILAVDPPTFLDVAWTRGDLAGDSLPSLTQRLVTEDPDGVRVAGPVSAMQIWVWSPGLDAELLLDVTDARGRACVCTFGSLAFSGDRVLTSELSFAHPPAYPLRLRGMTVKAGSGQRHSGALGLGGLAAVASDGGVTEVEPFTKADGWWHMSQGPLSDTAELDVATAHMRSGQPAAVLDVNLDRGQVVVRPAPSDRPIPALVAASTLQKLGVKLGQAFPMHVDAAVVDVVGVGVVDYFPTLYPGTEDFLVLPRDTILDRLGHQHYSLAWPNEAWLKVDGAGAASAETSLRKSTDLLEIVDRHQVQEQALGDPLRRALQATLLVGFAAALAMALVGFALHFLVATRSRLSEYAILQANGLGMRTIRRSLLVEQVVLLLFSVAVGAAIALLLSWAILPALQIGTSTADLVPPTLVTVDPVTAGGVLVLVALVGAGAGAVITRLGARYNLLEELRGLG